MFINGSGRRKSNNAENLSVETLLTRRRKKNKTNLILGILEHFWL